MLKGIFCPNVEAYRKDPRFQDLMKQDAYKSYTDNRIAYALTMYIERNPQKYDIDYVPQTPQERGAFTRYLRYQLARDEFSDKELTLTQKAVKDMYESLYAVFTPAQLASRIDLVYDAFITAVDNLQNSDKTGRTRQELIKAYGDETQNGYSKIIAGVFARYEEIYGDFDKMKANYLKAHPNATPREMQWLEYVFNEWQTIFENKERLAALAAKKIGETEGFLVHIGDDMKVSLEPVTDEQIAEQEENDQQNDGTDYDEGQKGERFEDFRLLKLMETLGPRARRLISRIPRIVGQNEKGENIYSRDDLGLIRYLDNREVAITLTRVLQYSTPATFMDDLRNSLDTYPWLSSIIDKLEKDHQARQTLYTAFKKVGIMYVTTYKDGSSYNTKIANSSSQGRALMRRAGINLQEGWTKDETGKSVYLTDGMLKSAAELSQISKNADEFMELVMKDTKYIRMLQDDKPSTNPKVFYEGLPGPDAMKAYLAMPDKANILETMAQYIRGLGFQITANDIYQVITVPMSAKSFAFINDEGWQGLSGNGRNKLYQLARAVQLAYQQAVHVRQKVGNTGLALYSSSTQEYSRINDILALSLYEEIEPRVVNEGKSQSALMNPNLLNDIMDELTNKSNQSEEKYRDTMNEQYIEVEGMSASEEYSVVNAATGQTETRKRTRATGWLKWLYEGVFNEKFPEDNPRETMRVVKVSGFNNKPYAQLTRQQKITSSILEYMDSARVFGKAQYRLYEVPLQGDYGTAYDFILAPKLELGTFYDEKTDRYGENSPLVDALVDEVCCELERIEAIEERVRKDKDGEHRPVLKVYEQEGSKFQIFPEFNDNGFRASYVALKNDSDAAEQFIRKSIVDQLKKVIDRDIKTINDSHILENRLLAKHGLVAKDGKFENLSQKKQQELVDFFMNDFYARLQMVKVLDGGLHQFNGVVDFEKRNMLLHAPRTPLYTEAEWNGERVGREFQNSLYIEDEESESAFFDSIDECLDVLKKQKLITNRQYRSMRDTYKKIKSTDGQGFRTLEAYRAFRIMSDNWDDRHEDAYKRIVAGVPTKGDIDLFMEGLKPVTTGYEFINVPGGKRIKLTVLHKYSEQVLLPLALAKYCVTPQSAPLQAFNKVADAMAKKGTPIDVFIFGSGVKVGGHSLLRPFARWGDLKEEEREKRGYTGGKEGLKNHILTDADSMAEYMLSTIAEKPWSVHTTPFKYTGIAASTTPHGAEDKIARSSQMEKALWADILDGDEVEVDGEKISAYEARNRYYDIKTAEIVEQFERVRKVFRNQREMSRILDEELATKSYYSSELPYAIKALRTGKFALPLFSPGIEHPVQQLLASVIKKRMTKQKGKGSNLMISSGLGVEIDVSPYKDGLDDKYKLGVAFEGEGENKRVKWFDAAVPLPESLKPFANKDGVITPDMLWGYTDKDGNHVKGLVEKGIIPEEALFCIAARNPADAIHSAMPLRIKWFKSNMEGGGAIVAKEAMVTTGQDFDGDKLRFDFKEWDIVWNDELLQKDFEEIHNNGISLDDDVEIMRSVHGQSTSIRDFESWKRWAISDANPVADRYRKVQVVKYDYSKSALENSSRKRHNGQIELMFAQLTSPAGSRRMLMAGGCEDSKVYAKSIYLTKHFGDKELLNKLFGFMVRPTEEGGLGMSETSVEAMGTSAANFYKELSKMDDWQLTKLMRVAMSAEAPYSFSHSVDAFEIIVGGKEMISTYAVYNSTSQMLQRINLEYYPYVSKKGDARPVSLFNKNIGELFDVRSREHGILASIALSHLVNAAVDNNKDPILGYLNQTREMSEMTYFLVAAGYTEEEIHLLMNQPVIIELASRMKGKNSSDLADVITKLVEEYRDKYYISDTTLSWWKAIDEAAKLTEDNYANSMEFKYDSLPDSQQIQQLAVLEVFNHLAPSAKALAEFTRLVRPETSSGAIGSTVASIANKTMSLENFREKIAKGNGMVGRISGMAAIVKHRDVQEGWKASVTRANLGDKLPEVVAHNSLMMDTALDMFAPFFPEARMDWYEKVREIANLYSYESMPDSIIERIAKEMILWKLFQKKDFVSGDHRAEQERMLIDVPYRLKALKERISKAEKNPASDPVAASLISNAFIQNLSITDPTDKKNPRLRFMLNGPAIEGMADNIRYGWNQLLQMGDEMKKLAHDLFKYNMYTAGFGYGMYEFAHFAPMSVLLTMPGYTSSLNDILKESWDDEEFENFIGQYVRNHWGDDRFLAHVKLADLPNGIRELFKQEPLSDAKNNEKWGKIIGREYIVVEWDATDAASGKKKKVYRLVWIQAPEGPRVCELLGVRGKSGQITLQYNPQADIKDGEIKPVLIGNDTPWGNLTPSISDVDATANYNAEDSYMDTPEGRLERNRKNLAEMMGLKPSDIKATEILNDMIVASNAQNTAALEKFDKEQGENIPGNTGTKTAALDLEGGNTPIATINGMGALSMSGVDLSKLAAARITDAEGLVPEDEPSTGGPLLSIARIDENGKAFSEKVHASPNNIRLARRQRVQAELNARLRDILRKRGVAVGVLTETEARLRINGITDFDTAEVLANGMVEMIRLREGFRGEEALPEEFAHMGVAMIGRDNPFVKRINRDLQSSEQALREAFGDQYEDYLEAYNGDQERMRDEAIGKLVSKYLLREQEIQTYTIRGLIMRLSDAIKDFFGRFNRNEIQKAIFDANRVARGLARELLGGRILDDRSIADVRMDGKLLAKTEKIKKDLSDKDDILSRILKTEIKKLKLLQTRQGYNRKTPGKGSSIDATKIEIARLEKSIEEHKVEDAIVGYMHSGIEFVINSHKSLENYIMHGLPANKVCKKLNASRDILLSYSTVIQAVRDAIVDGEIADSKLITDAISELESVLGRFYTYYNTQGMKYLESMLAGVYGENGLTVNVGKDRGRHISIQEMARRQDRDISFMSRWFNSVADNNDYVLKAMDSMVRGAKQDAFGETLKIQRRIAKALDDLEKATGSRDQRFLFEYERGDDGKMHKTGKYISAEQVHDTLSAAQLKYYNEMMKIKAEIDLLVPETMIQEGKIVMLRKLHQDKVRESDGIKKKMIEEWEGIRNMVLDTSDDIDFDTYEVSLDFGDNPVDLLPLKYLAKGKNETYDDMSDDVATSMLAYAGMANEYAALNGIIGVLENAKYMSSRRDVGQHVGTREMIENVSTDEMEYKKPFRVKGARTKIQELMEDFMQMQVYGHMQSNEGTIGRTRMSKRKLVNFVTRITSLSQMALNLPQRITNVSVGGAQIFVEGMGGSAYNLKNFAKAAGIWIKESADRLADTGKTDYDNKLSLFLDYFDIHQNNKGEFENTRMGKKRSARVFNTSLLFAGLTIGEDFLASATALSVAMNIHLKDSTGKPINLWDAYTVEYADPATKTGAYLQLKRGVTKEDGSPFTKEDEREFGNKVIGMNFDLQGIYNQNDKSAIQQYAGGALIIMYRKWIAPALKRRYGATQFSTLKGQYEEGYYRTWFRMLMDSVKDAHDIASEDESLGAISRIFATAKNMFTAYALNLEKMTDYERSNIRKAWTEFLTVIGLWISTGLLLRLPPDEEHDDDLLGWVENFGLSQLLRLRSELAAQAPTPIFVREGLRILKSPFAAIGPIQSTLNAFQLMLPHNYLMKIRSGRYKGHSRAYKYFREFPIISMFKKVENFIDPSSTLQYYKNDTNYWNSEE